MIPIDSPLSSDRRLPWRNELFEAAEVFGLRLGGFAIWPLCGGNFGGFFGDFLGGLPLDICRLKHQISQGANPNLANN
jgi:hypothetical protein